MALITCQECGREVSDQAEACPHCGHPAPEGAAAETVLHDVAPSMLWTHPFTTLISILLIAAFGLGLIILFVIWLQCHSTQLIVTTRRSTLRKGLFAKQTTEVLHRDVRNLQVDQSFLQRMVGIGRLSISSAGQSDLEISIEGIHDPDGIARTIRQYQ